MPRLKQHSESARPWSALPYHREAIGSKTRAVVPIRHFDWWQSNGSTHQLLPGHTFDEISPPLHHCFPADRRSHEWDHQRDRASQQAISMRVQQEMMDLEFAICVTMPKIRAMEHKLSLALDDVQQGPCVRMRMDSIECTFKKTRVKMRPAPVEHLASDVFAVQSFRPGGLLYSQIQAMQTHTEQVAFVQHYQRMADEAKEHLQALESEWRNISTRVARGESTATAS